MMEKIACAACRHEIDAAAKTCPYCGSDPRSGEKVVDTNALLQDMFHSRHVSASESILEYARQRQGVAVAVGAILLIVILAGLHQIVTMRNEKAVSGAPAVPLSDIADVSAQPDSTKPAPMPDLNFQYDGNAQAMRTFVVEPGAVAPAPTTSGGQAPPPVPQNQPATASR
ncbi:MAG TPA: zinc ribbon domain-containing protein [Thermoanaerobaculia bacterium]|nr:zinc ribbon domain-containing protein [Thermoanaerobaculia bacterium]